MDKIPFFEETKKESKIKINEPKTPSTLPSSTALVVAPPTLKVKNIFAESPPPSPPNASKPLDAYDEITHKHTQVFQEGNSFIERVDVRIDRVNPFDNAHQYGSQTYPSTHYAYEKRYGPNCGNEGNAYGYYDPGASGSQSSGWSSNFNTMNSNGSNTFGREIIKTNPPPATKKFDPRLRGNQAPIWKRLNANMDLATIPTAEKKPESIPGLDLVTGTSSLPVEDKPKKLPAPIKKFDMSLFPLPADAKSLLKPSKNSSSATAEPFPLPKKPTDSSKSVKPKSSAAPSVPLPTNANRSSIHCKECSYSGDSLVEHYVNRHRMCEVPIEMDVDEILTTMVPLSSKDGVVVPSASNHSWIPEKNQFSTPVKCRYPNCLFQTVLRFCLMDHIEKQHSNKTTEGNNNENNVNVDVVIPELFCCHFCDFEISSKNIDQFREHVTSHTGEYNYICSLCEKHGPTSQNIKRHIHEKHKNSDNGTKRGAFVKVKSRVKEVEPLLLGYMCSLCGFVQLNKEAVVRHISNRHNVTLAELLTINMSKRHKGPPTQKLVSKNSDLKSEILDELYQDAGIDDECIVINGGASKKRKIKEDYKDIGKKRCEMQDLSNVQQPTRPTVKLSYKDKLRSWKARGRLYFCGVPRCKDFFANNRDSFQFHHASKHQHLSVLHCSECDSRFSMNSRTSYIDFLKHVEVAHHNDTNAPPIYTCYFDSPCQFLTSNKGLFRGHVHKSHSMSSVFECYWCNERFSNASVLADHIEKCNIQIKVMKTYRECGVEMFCDEMIEWDIED